MSLLLGAVCRREVSQRGKMRVPQHTQMPRFFDAWYRSSLACKRSKMRVRVVLVFDIRFSRSERSDVRIGRAGVSRSGPARADCRAPHVVVPTWVRFMFCKCFGLRTLPFYTPVTA